MPARSGPAEPRLLRVSEGELLTGDGVTQGIVRIGDTVRRPLRPFSLTIQAYLAHLRDAGFTGAPLPLIQMREDHLELRRQQLPAVSHALPHTTTPAANQRTCELFIDKP